MIVEYFGIPGCGKTYQANLYKQQLKQEGKKFIDISRYNGMSLWLKMFYKIADYAILVLPKYRKQIARYKEICKKCHKVSVPISFSVDILIKNIVLYSFVYDIFKYTKRIVINDEGQLHRIILLIMQFELSIEHIAQLYKPGMHFERIIYVNVTVDTAENNIKKRKRKICEFDNLEGEKLRFFLLKNREICERVNLYNWDVALKIQMI